MHAWHGTWQRIIIEHHLRNRTKGNENRKQKLFIFLFGTTNSNSFHVLRCDDIIVHSFSSSNICFKYRCACVEVYTIHLYSFFKIKKNKNTRNKGDDEKSIVTAAETKSSFSFLYFRTYMHAS